MYFQINEKLPSLNEVINENRRNKYSANNKKKEIEKRIIAYIYDAIKNHTLKKIDSPCTINIEWFEKTKRRDVDNIQSSQKFILDALQKSGILPNDNRKYVKQVFHCVYDSDTDGVMVRIMEDEE